MPNSPSARPQESVEQLTADFQQALQQQPIDAGVLLELSTRLASLDPDFVRFSVDAGLIDRLGRELVTRQETAVSELIKNAYDADATYVDLLFQNAELSGGSLTITDNGSGMTREQLVGGFMRLSSTDKVREPISPVLGRQRAGRKGIGRFAVQRLGQHLEVITQTDQASYALRIMVDWSQFVGGIELGSIASRIEEVEKHAEHGTTIIIRGLREPWSEAALRRVYRSISELIQPVTLRDKRPPLPQEAAKVAQEPLVIGSEGTDFQISLRRDDGEREQIVNETSEVLEHALAVIEGFVDEEGRGYWSYKSKPLELREDVLPIGHDREKSDSPFPHLRNVDFKVYYFIFKSGFIGRSVHKTIQQLAELRGGIRLYRNGLRVPPYGEERDDWLRLEASSRNRDLLPPHANFNFFGFVEIYDPQGDLFEETANRERLLEDQPAFVELRDFVYRSIIAAVTRIAEARGRKVKANQPGWKKKSKPSETLQPSAQALKDALENADQAAGQEKEDEGGEETPPIADGGDNGNGLPGGGVSDDTASDDGGTITLPVSLVRRIAGDINQAISQGDSTEQDYLEEVGMLRVLSSLGLVIGEFTHEVRQTLGSAMLNAKHLKAHFPPNQEEGVMASDLWSNLERFNQYVSYFDRTIRERNHRELAPQDLRKVLNDWVNLIKPNAIKAHIDLAAPDLTDDLLLTCPMHASEWASILFNFYSNATKAIERAGAEGRMHIGARKIGTHIYLEFADNGDGVPEANVERIFAAFFTTSTPAGADAEEEEASQGNGLGLKIVQDIAHSYGGTIQVVDAPPGFATCFQIEFPAATQEQIEEYGY